MDGNMCKGGKKFFKGFTLTELMIVIILAGIIAGFGIPAYGRLVRKSHERSAILGLTTINQANEIYKIKNSGAYLPGAGLTLAGINTGLSIDVKSQDLTYEYTRTAVNAYTATAKWTGSGAYWVEVDQGPVSTGVNPHCAPASPGSCPTLP